LNGTVVTFDPGKKAKKGIQSDRSQEKWDAQASRVTAKQQDPLQTGVLVTRDDQNGGENRSDTRRPSCSKSQSHQKGTQHANGFAIHTKSLLIIQKLDLKHTGDVQSEDDDQDTSDAVKEYSVLQQKTACIGG